MYSGHLGMPGVMISLDGRPQMNLARIINDWCQVQHVHVPNVLIKVPMVNPLNRASHYRKGSKEEFEGTWLWWNRFRLQCNSDKRCLLLLEVGADLPSREELLRWLGEPIKAILLPTSLFLTNKKGYPVLSQAHQSFLKMCADQNIHMVVTGTNRHASFKHYVQYLEYIYKTAYNSDPMCGNFSKGYEDHLQYPLQPLMDNLESGTYEVFEKDPVKYTEYRHAIHKALCDRMDTNDPTKELVVMVVGAGRGPLVTAAIQASESSHCPIKLYAVEKNPNAVVTLLNLKEEVWGDTVEVVNCDMRQWAPPEKCDILISELLGSFGDNELSPECLDGAQRFLKDDGISIPCSYTSYLAPIQSSRLYNEARLTSPGEYKHPSVRFEMPYVVHQLNVYRIADPQKCFSFVHPNKDEKIDNTRYVVLEFEASQDTVIHGFAGYFDTVLYKGVTLSIVPNSYSKGMFSWFPIYFPIREPVEVKKGEKIVVHFWRLCNFKSVWYEWALSSPSILSVHNPNGRSYEIGLH